MSCPKLGALFLNMKRNDKEYLNIGSGSTIMTNFYQGKKSTLMMDVFLFGHETIKSIYNKYDGVNDVVRIYKYYIFTSVESLSGTVMQPLGEHRGEVSSIPSGLTFYVREMFVFT
ncbi:hypothetical protein RF11_14023 [Thelohanellus kitauei]|uniref:Uncharacterized protein n=1 Tax=Thelohanellus kitauei TaxID=669202 RepID=A0A0C2MLZ8_THEKT|nr:hypothetical protein RF11_14023 [Thelohanellus kitauei]